jgi:hypothetical protein
MTALVPSAVRSASSSTVVLALAAGITWVLGVTLVATQADTDPVGPGYDDANRVVTLASVLLLASAVAAWRRRRGRAGLVVVIGTASMLLGSALEFVVLPLAGGTPDALVAQGGATSPLSTGGFLVFAVGCLLVLGGCVALAVSLRRRPRADRLVIALTGPALVAGTALWAVDPAPAAIASCVAAFGWWRTVTAD